MEALAKSFSALKSGVRLSRLLQEDDEIEGCGFFHKKPERSLHILGNIVRLFITLFLWPLYLFIPRSFIESIGNYIQSDWLLEFATTPDAVLTNTLNGDRAQYDVTGFRPSWVLKVTVHGGELHHFRQIEYSQDVETAGGYTALSYPMASAVVLFKEAGLETSPPPPGRDYTLLDRQRIAEQLLRLYCSAIRQKGHPDRTEYVWLDEFCLSDFHLDSEDQISQQRSIELGRLADIFRNANQVTVFCHEHDCDHTGLDCIWGTRLWTIPEILHAQNVSRLTRRRVGHQTITSLFPTTARAFREALQMKAALGNRWHLYAIYQHTVNTGAVPWQVAIQALVVEAIRRDEAGGYHNHIYLGKALNGLLPRRARLLDLGRSGWNDLAWLLELNQGYYNAASLAAVCSIAEDPSVSWLGKPIHPAVGNERLEPLVTALPVSTLGFDDGLKNPSTREKPEASPPLTIIGAKMIGLRPNLKRDAQGLYNNEEMKGLKILSMCVAFVLVVIGTLLLSQGQVFSGLAVYYVTGFAFVIVELLIGTMYLEREGWIFLPEAQWPGDPQECLGEQDSNLRTLVNWGQRQLVPEWEAPRRRRWFKGKLVDLRNRVWVDTIAVGHPNAMMPLAIHGGGVTCMLLDRAKDLEMDVTLGSQKVGMTNLPPYALSQTVKIGSMSVGSHP